MRWAVAGAATALVLFGVAVLPNTTSSMRLIQPGNQQQPGNALLGGLTPNAEAASHLLRATDGAGSTGSVGVVVGGPAALRGGTNGAGRGALEPTATITQTTGEGNTGGAAGTLPRLDIPITEPEWMHEEASMARFTRASAGVWSAESVGVRELGARSRSQDKEDVTAYKKYFFGRGGGTFMEMGALDGLKFSNTYAYEMLLGWRGVHIEASPQSYKRLVSNRPGQVNVHAAVCDKPQLVHYLDEGNPAVRGIAEFMAPRFIEQFHPEVAKDGLTKVPAVQCQPLSAIMTQLGIQHINFFVLDVEGAELLILKSIDFSTLSFDVISVEGTGHDPEKDQGVIALLTTKGYTWREHLGRNDWFVRDGFLPAGEAELNAAA